MPFLHVLHNIKVPLSKMVFLGLMGILFILYYIIIYCSKIAVCGRPQNYKASSCFCKNKAQFMPVNNEVEFMKPIHESQNSNCGLNAPK